MSVVQTQSQDGHNVSSVTVSVLSTGSGNLLILVVGSTNAVLSVTDNQGNSWVQRQVYGNDSYYDCQGATGGVTSVTAAVLGPDDCSLVFREYSGVAGAYDQGSNPPAHGTGLSLAANTNSATSSSSELVIGWAVTTVGQTVNAGTGFSNFFSSPGITKTGSIEDKTVSATGIQTATFTTSHSVSWVCGVATYPYSGGSALTYTASDAVGLSDSRSGGFTKSLSEQVALSEFRSASAGRHASDALGLSDRRVNMLSGMISEILSVFDANSILTSRGLTDGASPEDSVISSYSPTFTISDGLGLVDSESASSTIVRTEMVTVGLIDARLIGTVMGELLPLVDGATKQISPGDLLDAIGFTDSEQSQIATRLLQDVLELADSVGRAVGRMAVDPLNLMDSESATTSRAFLDSIGFSDHQSRAVTSLVSDVVLFVDSAARAGAKAILDSIVLSDTAHRSASHLASDTVPISEALNRAIRKAASQSIGVTDSLQKSGRKAVTEAILLTEAHKSAVGKELAQAIGISDSRAAAISHILDDLFGLSGLVESRAGKLLTETVSDADFLADSVRKRAGHVAAQPISFTDSHSAGTTKRLTDTIAISDEASSILHHFLSAQDRLGISDAVLKAAVRLLSDTLYITDTQSATFVAAYLQRRTWALRAGSRQVVI